MSIYGHNSMLKRTGCKSESHAVLRYGEDFPDIQIKECRSLRHLTDMYKLEENAGMSNMFSVTAVSFQIHYQLRAAFSGFQFPPRSYRRAELLFRGFLVLSPLREWRGEREREELRA